MARWSPGPAIKPGEYVGRRVFDTNTSALDKHSLSPNLFLDTRLHEDLSFDRLGEGSIAKQVVTFLTPICDHEGHKQQKTFFGWLAALRRSIKYEEVRPDPLTEAVHGVENPYHALLDRSAARQRGQAFHLSRSLFISFQENGQVVLPIRTTLR